MIITFIGHSEIIYSEKLYWKMIETILESTRQDEKISFYCGGYGDFDNLSVKACGLIKEKRPNSEILFVSPYLEKTAQNRDYDGTIYPPIEGVPFKFAIVKRNEWMVEKADLVIAYVKHTYGGAYKWLIYARKRGKPIINLAAYL